MTTKKNRRSKGRLSGSWMPSQEGLERWPNRPKVVYLCGTDYLTELGPHGFNGPVSVYNSIADLKGNSTCWHQCGIVRVELGAPKWVVKEDFFAEVPKKTRRGSKKAGLKRAGKERSAR